MDILIYLILCSCPCCPVLLVKTKGLPENISSICSRLLNSWSVCVHSAWSSPAHTSTPTSTFTPAFLLWLFFSWFHSPTYLPLLLLSYSPSPDFLLFFLLLITWTPSSPFLNLSFSHYPLFLFCFASMLSFFWSLLLSSSPSPDLIPLLSLSYSSPACQLTFPVSQVETVRRRPSQAVPGRRTGRTLRTCRGPRAGGSRVGGQQVEQQDKKLRNFGARF